VLTIFLLVAVAAPHTEWVFPLLAVVVAVFALQQI
jgi:hypothetical protein